MSKQHARRYHYGNTPAGHKFPDSLMDYKSKVAQPFLDFVTAVYRKFIRYYQYIATHSILQLRMFGKNMPLASQKLSQSKMHHPIMPLRLVLRLPILPVLPRLPPSCCRSLSSHPGYVSSHGSLADCLDRVSSCRGSLADCLEALSSYHGSLANCLDALSQYRSCAYAFQ